MRWLPLRTDASNQQRIKVRLGGVSQKMVARVWRRADAIVEGGEGEEGEGEGKNFTQPTNLYQTWLVCDPLRIDRWAARGVIPTTFPRSARVMGSGGS